MVSNMKDVAIELIKNSWPMVFISVVIFSSLRIIYIIKNKERFVLYEEIIKLAFLVYVLFLFQVVTFQDVSFGSHNYIPFKEIFRYDIGSYLFYKNIIGNVLLFLPIGFFATMYTKIDKSWKIIILSSIWSLFIEATQSMIGRIFDIDDIILNIIGATLGYYLYKIVSKLNSLLKEKSKVKEIVLNILSLILIGGLIWFLVH